MVKAKLAMWSLFVILSAFAGFSLATQSAKLATSAEQIAPHEAEILIYLLPQAQELRKQGMDVGWELQTSPKLNQPDFYTYWLVNSKRPNVEGSVTLGYFSVNKHTAEVWDDNNEKVKVPEAGELEGVERILRRAHHIDEETLHKFSSLRP
jgi:hypothetical protein